MNIKFTAEEIAASRRQGGPADTHFVTAKCLDCAYEAVQSLRWYDTVGAVCPRCHGRLDEEPWRRFTIGVLQDLERAAEKNDRLRDPSG
jgi:hypothetical protein